MDDRKCKVLAAAEMAAVSNVSNLTNDRIEALAGGHGMVNIAIHTVANTIVQEINGGGTVNVKFADARTQPVDMVLKKAIDTAKASGADGANAAMITAVMMYLAGSAAQVGIPAGNRKLGATCRMIAGVDRSGVGAIPTSKMNSKISAFPAVLAINQAMMNGELSPISGRDVPANVGGGPLYGHSALGEDIIWPAMAEKGAEIGVKAMLDAMAGAGISPDPLQAALLGSAAILEIIHPDAEVPEGEGRYGRTTSVRLVGKAAVKTAGLPEKVHMILTGQEFDTAQLVGDIGLILKDIGAPSVIGMMALAEILACFREGISSGFSSSPVNPPLGHQGSYAVATMKALLEEGADKNAIAKQIAEERCAATLNPESAMLSINIIARKADEVSPGPVTRLMIQATEPARTKAIYEKASYTYEQLSAGKTIAEIVKALDDERLETVEKQASVLFTAMAGQPVTVSIQNLHSAARRTAKLVKKYWSFDAYADVTVTMGENKAVMEGFVHDVIPRVCKGECQDVAWAVPFGAAVMDDLSLSGCNILNVVVPAAVASAMGIDEPAVIAEQAERAAYVTVGIPGAKAHATEVGNMARDIAEAMM
ncbi:MAG: hypothetical protein LUF78_09955 [Clostridiales bacterium]|nr:hypothetical protein [Clostridiales bacterium]